MASSQVVRARIQCRDLVLLRIANGEHDNGNIGSGADFAAGLMPSMPPMFISSRIRSYLVSRNFSMVSSP